MPNLLVSNPVVFMGLQLQHLQGHSIVPPLHFVEHIQQQILVLLLYSPHAQHLQNEVTCSPQPTSALHYFSIVYAFGQSVEFCFSFGSQQLGGGSFERQQQHFQLLLTQPLSGIFHESVKFLLERSILYFRLLISVTVHRKSSLKPATIKAFLPHPASNHFFSNILDEWLPAWLILDIQADMAEHHNQQLRE